MLPSQLRSVLGVMLACSLLAAKHTGQALQSSPCQPELRLVVGLPLLGASQGRAWSAHVHACAKQPCQLWEITGKGALPASLLIMTQCNCGPV